jgi:hypothetical protein
LKRKSFHFQSIQNKGDRVITGRTRIWVAIPLSRERKTVVCFRKRNDKVELASDKVVVAVEVPSAAKAWMIRGSCGGIEIPPFQNRDDASAHTA